MPRFGEPCLLIGCGMRRFTYILRQLLTHDLWGGSLGMSVSGEYPLKPPTVYSVYLHKMVLMFIQSAILTKLLRNEYFPDIREESYHANRNPECTFTLPTTSIG
ncbi:hypothetical protein PSHT_11948 [Puccinia striiformis]|uniref:Uncharacterized protein n=1 Tax=Puccinia striiformis TaxID=27350 RepID=A0A2S4UZY0_9BASI|nr:hypothetical protein PSHT_11948 [Puccinia striiformis]